MPTVPIYNGPQVRQDALKPVRQQNIDVSSGMQAVAAGLNDVAQVTDRVAMRRAEADANEVDAQITRDWNQWEDENRKNYQGKDATGYTAAVEAWWKKSAEVYGKDLSPVARGLIGSTLQRRQTVAMDGAGKYQSVELERHADSAAFASINRAVEFGVRTGDTEGQAQAIRDTISEMGRRKGWTKEQREEAEGKHIATLHLGTLSKMASINADAAQAYFEKALSEGEIPPEHQGRIRDTIKGEADNQFATGFAAQNAGLPLDQQLKEAGTITDPQRREKALMQIKNNYAMVKEAQRAQEADFADKAWQFVGKGQRVPEALLAGMDGRERVQLQEHLRAKAERALSGAPVKTDMATYIDVREKLAAGEKVDLRAYTEKIGGAQMEQLLDIQTAVGKGGVKQDAILTDEARIGSALTGLGISKKKNPEAAAAFAMEVDRRVRVESTARGGKDLTADEKQKIIDNVALDKVYVDEWGRDPTTPTVLLKPEQMQDAYVNVGGKPVKLNSIPSTDRAQIIASLKKRGLQATEQAVAEIYMLKKGK